MDSYDHTEMGSVDFDTSECWHVGRKASRFASAASTCSTSLADGQSESEETSSDGDCSVVGRVWLLSRDPEGSRQVQAALESAPSIEAREALVEELHGHVAKAMRCPHANHVLQQCVALMPPDCLQFIVDELLAREGLVAQAARHRYACRIVQQMLGKCPWSQTAELVEALLREAPALACHTFGHYTMERLLELGTEDQRYRLVRSIERNIQSIGLSGQGGVIIVAALTCAASGDRIWIARAVLQAPEVLLALAIARQGSSAVTLVLQTLGGRERKEACEVLLTQVKALRASKEGCRVVAELLSDAVLA